MLAYLGKTVIIAVRNGVTFRGRVCWAWFWGHWCLRDVQLLDEDEGHPQEVLGKTLIPMSSVTFVQVL